MAAVSRDARTELEIEEKYHKGILDEDIAEHTEGYVEQAEEWVGL